MSEDQTAHGGPVSETCDAAGCGAIATKRVADTRGYEVAVACDADAWRFETRTFPIGDQAAFDKAEPPGKPPDFGEWWDSLPDGWPASRAYRDLMEKTWNAARGLLP